MDNYEFFIDKSSTYKPNFEFTPSGLLRVSGAIARTGEMQYHTKEGRVYHQYVPPDVLFAQTHLDSIAGLPVTLHHPTEQVTPENYSRYAVGSVGSHVFARVDKGLLEVIFTIGSREAIDAVTKDGINQLSMGYWAKLEKDPNNSDRLIQTERIGNHIALVDRARGGEQLKLNLDAFNITTDSIENIKELPTWRTLYVMA